MAAPAGVGERGRRGSSSAFGLAPAFVGVGPRGTLCDLVAIITGGRTARTITLRDDGGVQVPMRHHRRRIGHFEARKMYPPYSSQFVTFPSATFHSPTAN
jgi:hypothetical protein